jgi:hypothetical protein
MKCPQCHVLQRKGITKVLDVRKKEKGTVTRRTRLCLCGHKFTTYEKLGDENDKKSGGSSKITNRQKQKIYENRDWYTSEELANLFDVHVSTIRYIKRTYKEKLK